MRQILYLSTSAAGAGKADLAGILEQSRHNNAIDGVTGLLWSDGTRFLQAIEGPAASIEATFARIQADPRHDGIKVLHDRRIESREFGGWAMTSPRRGEMPDDFRARVGRLLLSTSEEVSDEFFALIEGEGVRVASR